MDLKDKMKIVKQKNGFTDNKEIAELLGIHPTLFNRNVRENRLTGDMLIAFANTPKIKVDLNWLAKKDSTLEVAEPEEVYGEKSISKLEQAIELLKELKKEVSPK